MDLDQKFHQRWDYRRKEDDVDSSSDDSKSSLGDEPVRKKQELVSNLSSSQEYEAIDSTTSQQNNQVDATKSAHFQIAEVTKKHLERGKKEIAVDNKFKRNSGKTRKRKVSNPIQDQDQDSALVNDLKVFAESLLKDLKVAREKMFVQMKKQMTKLVAAKPVSRQRRSSLKKSDGAMHQNGNKSGRKIQSCDVGLKNGSKKDNLGFDSRKSSNAKGEKTKHEKAALESNGMERRETLILPENKSAHLVKNSDQIGSSSYLTLPAVLPKPQTESLSTDSSLHDHIECGFTVNTANNAERENSVVDANNHYSYLLGIQPEEQFGSFAQITSKSVGFLDQRSSQISSRASGLPVPLHQWPNNGFNMTSQSALKNPAQENNTASLRMNVGGIGFPGRSHALPECFAANTISSNMNYNTNTDGGLVSFRSGEVKKRSSGV